MGFSHIAVYVESGKLEDMVQWYLAVLKPLGYAVVLAWSPHII